MCLAVGIVTIAGWSSYNWERDLKAAVVVWLLQWSGSDRGHNVGVDWCFGLVAWVGWGGLSGDDGIMGGR